MKINHDNIENIISIKDKRSIDTFQGLIKDEAGLEALTYFTELGIFQTDKIIVLSSKHSFSYDEEYISDIRILFNLKKMNTIQRLGFLFYKINNILPLEGYYIGCYEDVNTVKKIFDSSKAIGKVWYYLFYFVPLLLHRIPLLNHIISLLRKGSRKHLSSFDVQRIMVKNGFRVVTNKEFNGRSFFIAKKIKEVNQIRSVYFKYFERILDKSAIIKI